MKFYQKTVFLLLLLTLVLATYGCKAELSEAETDMLTMKYELSDEEELEPFYVSDTKIYAAVNKIDLSQTEVPNFGAATERFIVYDYKTGKEEARYNLDENNAYIYHAMPFEQGIIYAVYTLPEPDAAMDESIQWNVKYTSDEGTRVLDSGRCRSVYVMPGFAILDGDVYYLYENFNEKSGYGFGINRADLYNPETMMEEKDYSISETEFYSNGTDFAILVDGKHDVLIGNAEGIYREYDLPEKMSHFGICKDYIFCCTTSNENQWTARSISLETGEEYMEEIKMPLYRISSMSGDELTCVDMRFDMYILRPGKKFEIVPVDATPEILTNRKYVRYYPYGDTKTLAQIDETKFCRITW